MIVHTHHMYTMQGDGVGYEKDKSIAVDSRQRRDREKL